jgi:hypothetical protein
MSRPPAGSDGLPDAQAVRQLVASAGFDHDVRLSQLPGGANNRVYRVCGNGVTGLVKSYFQHLTDRRDRLGAEFAFSSYAWDSGVRAVAQPLACDATHRLALYEFIEGRHLLQGEITERLVREAVHFYLAINRHRHSPRARTLPMASEACFRIGEHLSCVERRIRRLLGTDDLSAINRDAIGFVRHELLGMWSRVQKAIGRRARRFGLTLDAEIAPGDRCLSPSDFGFHNALVAPDERLRFIDFEYAGWDDPARMVCDIFCQPQIPVPTQYYGLIVDMVAGGAAEPWRCRQRVDILLPAYRLKWCCILLNDFLPDGGERRRFSGNDPEYQKAEQLRKARQVLDTVVL